MRDFLLTHEPEQGLTSYGLTLTVPGPPIEPENARRLWDHFAKHYLVRNGCGAVWRLEVQSRGAAHWHCLLSAPKKINGEKIEKVVLKWWLDALDILPPWYCHDFQIDGVTPPNCILYKTPPPDGWPPDIGDEWNISRQPDIVPRVLFGHRVVTVEKSSDLRKFSLSNWPGARIYAVDVQGEGGRGAWLRYLQDHATKSKQEQIAQGFGRHWGVVGRGKFVESVPDAELVYSSRETYFRFWRVYHRLTRPQMSWRRRREKTGTKFLSRPFGGRSLGWSSQRGIYGASVWFSKPETVKRLYEWAESCPTERSEESSRHETLKRVGRGSSAP
jgi:hypothetical protein